MVACRTALILIIASTTSLSAQSPLRPTVDAARANNWYVRFTTLQGDSAAGRVTAVRNDTVRVGRTSVALGDVAIIDRRIRRGGGALPGALFGAATVGFVGASLSGLCESDCEWAWLIGLGGGAAMGLTVGTAIGALAAPGRIVWQRVHPPEDSTRTPEVTKRDDANPFVGGGVTFSFGTGWSFEEQDYRILRLGLQLSGTTARKRLVETTGEFALVAAPDGGGAAILTTAGANLMWNNGAYVGPVVGFTFGDGPMPTVGGRVGIRPRGPGLRPEVRADYVFDEGSAFLLTFALGLEVH
jgi:hypothetical protein